MLDHSVRRPVGGPAVVYGVGMGTRWVGGGVYRVGTGRGYTGYPAALLGEQSWYSEAGPGSPGGAGVGGTRAAGERSDGTAPGTTPAGPGRSLWALPVPGPSECPPWTNRARFHVLFLKVSQNGEVSSKSVHKACHSPYIQKRVQEVTS